MTLSDTPTRLGLLGLVFLLACNGDGNDTGDLATDADADGYVQSEDCDDTNPDINPGADETCNGLDDNCNGIEDEGLADCDGDVTEDGDGDGVTEADGDCDDEDPNQYPGADETCNEEDDDCDGEVDEDALDATILYADTDGDGYGDPEAGVTTCETLNNYVENSDDCDDTTSAISPSGEEVCDGVDNNCDGVEDEGFEVATWYQDADGDGYGIDGVTEVACEQPTGYAAEGGDCDDDPATGVDVHPGQAEDCGDGIDNDCNGETDVETVTIEFSVVGLDSSTADDAYCSHPEGFTVTADGDYTAGEYDACQQSSDAAYVACHPSNEVFVTPVSNAYVEETCYTTINEQTSEYDIWYWENYGRCMWLYPADSSLELTWSFGEGSTWNWETNSPFEDESEEDGDTGGE